MISEAKKQLKNTKCVALGLILAVSLFPVRTGAEAAAKVVIYQVQTGAPASASQEYISIHNNSLTPVDITDWCVAYSSASDATKSELACFSPPDFNTRIVLPENTSAVLATNEFLQAHADARADLVFAARISGTAGHIKLFDDKKSIADVVGWGSAAVPEGKSTTAPPSGKILQRGNAEDNFLQDSGNNQADFSVASLSLIKGGNLEEVYNPIQLEDAPLTINEVLPNAEGTDTGKEFIEFYNRLDRPVSLEGYRLEIGPDYADTYVLPNIVVPAGGYAALSDTQTGLTLPNTTQLIRLSAPSGALTSAIDTYDSPSEGVAWAYINDSWQETHLPTPGKENVLKTEDDTFPPFPLSPVCKPDQVRNPETGRCRKIVPPVNPVACQPGQVRNPETGRCRKIESATAAKPCPSRQERNAETNRCRKVVSGEVSRPPKVKDVKTPLAANDIKLWAAGFAATGSLGYAGYEWRRELISFLNSLKSKFISD